MVEQEFEEVGLVRLGQGGCMLQVFVGRVCELLRCLGNGRRCMCAAVAWGSSA